MYLSSCANLSVYTCCCLSSALLASTISTTYSGLIPNRFIVPSPPSVTICHAIISCTHPGITVSFSPCLLLSCWAWTHGLSGAGLTNAPLATSISASLCSNSVSHHASLASCSASLFIWVFPSLPLTIPSPVLVHSLVLLSLSLLSPTRRSGLIACLHCPSHVELHVAISLVPLCWLNLVVVSGILSLSPNVFPDTLLSRLVHPPPLVMPWFPTPLLVSPSTTDVVAGINIIAVSWYLPLPLVP